MRIYGCVPECVTNAVIDWFSSRICICQDPDYASSVKKILACPSESIQSSMRRRGIDVLQCHLVELTVVVVEAWLFVYFRDEEYGSGPFGCRGFDYAGFLLFFGSNASSFRAVGPKRYGADLNGSVPSLRFIACSATLTWLSRPFHIFSCFLNILQMRRWNIMSTLLKSVSSADIGFSSSFIWLLQEYAKYLLMSAVSRVLRTHFLYVWRSCSSIPKISAWVMNVWVIAEGWGSVVANR